MFSQTASRRRGSTVRYVTGQLHTDNEPPAHQATHSLTLPSKVSVSEPSPACLMLHGNIEMSSLFLSLLRGIYLASKGVPSQQLVSWHGDNPHTEDFIKVFFFLPSFILSNVHGGQLECVWKSTLWVCQEEWNGVLYAGTEIVNQGVLGCKLCIIANWAASALLLKSASIFFHVPSLSLWFLAESVSQTIREVQ